MVQLNFVSDKSLSSDPGFPWGGYHLFILSQLILFQLKKKAEAHSGYFKSGRRILSTHGKARKIIHPRNAYYCSGISSFPKRPRAAVVSMMKNMTQRHRVGLTILRLNHCICWLMHHFQSLELDWKFCISQSCSQKRRLD